MSTVLVTGAAGNLGRRVTSSLLTRPFVDRVLAVDVVPMPAIVPRVEVHSFDLAGPGAPDELAALAKQAVAVLHLAWQPDGRHNLDVLGNVLDAVGAIEPSHLVHLSSATVYGAWPDNPVPITEEVPPRPNPELAYAVEKREAEVLVEHWGDDHPGTAVAVLRPACTVGSLETPLYEALGANQRPQLGSEGRLVQYLHMDDLASAVVHALEQGLSGTYNVAPDNGIKEELAGALAGGAAMLPLPAPVREGLTTWRWRHRGAPRGARPYAQHSWVVSGDKLRLTGWRPEYSSEQALVVSDKRRHWDELPQSRRVSVVLTGAAATVVAAGAGGAMWWRRHR